jgi:transposase-like protein
MALAEYLRKLGVGDDFLREGVRMLTQLLMELEVEEVVGAERYERTDARSTHRNGHRPRSWATCV